MRITSIGIRNRNAWTAATTELHPHPFLWEIIHIHYDYTLYSTTCPPYQCIFQKFGTLIFTLKYPALEMSQVWNISIRTCTETSLKYIHSYMYRNKFEISPSVHVPKQVWHISRLKYLTCKISQVRNKNTLENTTIPLKATCCT